jgi:hypothetical protein
VYFVQYSLSALQPIAPRATGWWRRPLGSWRPPSGPCWPLVSDQTICLWSCWD